MPKYFINPIHSELGIQRDGTTYDSKNYIDGQWCRFYEGDPRKIGGYEVVDNGTLEIVRDLFTVPRPNSIDLYVGRASTLSFITFDLDGVGGDEIYRTPTTVFVPSNNITWTFDLFTNSTAGIVSSAIVAAVGHNANDISSTFQGPIFYGDVSTTTPLTPIIDTNGDPVVCSGGIVFVSPVMVAYGNDGLMRWSTEGNINNWPALSDDPANFLVVANTKIVNAQRTRGGGTPTLLLWSLNSLCRATYTKISGVSTFVYDTIEDDISIISAGSVVKYNQQFFWIGTDQFYFYNGIVQKLPNTMNNDWFFEGVNLTYRSKIWGIAIPRFKEIWWFYPRGNTTECNAVIIYNVESQVWYDSASSRGAGVQTSIFPYPIMSDTNTIRTVINNEFVDTYPIWIHEKGTDQVQGNNVYAIDSYFETHKFDLWSSDGATSNFVRNRRIAPDFVQSGNMTATIKTQTYANSDVVNDGPYTFTSTTEKIDFASQGGIVSFQFRSNEAGGFYQGGKILYFYDVGDTFK